jgi:outer membrane protein
MPSRYALPLILLALLLVAGHAHAIEAPSQPPTLPAAWSAHEAVRFVLANNPDSRIGQQRLIAAQTAIDLARSAMTPQLTLSSQYSQTDTPMYSFGNILNQGEFSPTINFNDPGRTDSLNAAVQLGYRLYDGGRDRAGLKAAGSEAAAARMELAAVHARLAFEAVRAFYAITQATDIIQADQAAVTAVTASLNQAKARQEAGVLLADAVLDLEVQQSRAKENLIQAQHSLALAKKVFLTLLGVEDGSTAIATDAAVDQEIPATNAYGARFELKNLDAMIDAAQARVRQAEAGYYPAVDSFAAYQVDKGSVTGGSGDSWQAGVKLQYALFDGHRTSAEVAKASAQLAELREQRHKMELAIGLEVEQARLALQETEERLLVTEATVAQATKSAEINRARFAEGVVLSSDLIAVENRLTEATIRRTTAQTARRVAIADLRRANGLPQFADLIESAPAKR